MLILTYVKARKNILMTKKMGSPFNSPETPSCL